VLRPAGVRHGSSSSERAALAERIARLTGVTRATLGERLQALWGGYGELWRATLADGTSVIVKHVRPPRDDQSASHRRKLRSYAVEQNFYRHVAERCALPPACRTPRPLALAAEGGGWLFVLEDLDAAGFGERRSQADPAGVLAILRWLARFHARFLGSSPEGLWKVGTYWQLATRQDELRLVSHDALRRAAGAIAAELDGARFKTFVHGDAKLENVCFSGASGEAALVDFQYVGGGVGVKDVAYLLNGCVAPRDCEALVPRYLDDYFRELGLALAETGSIVDAGALEREWRALFPLAWVDFYRFLLGWAPGQLARDPYSERLTDDVLRRLKSA
jgi:hypothetical protein